MPLRRAWLSLIRLFLKFWQPFLYYQTEERKKREVVSEDISLELDKEKTSANNTKVRELTIELPKGKIQKYEDSEGTKMSRYSVYVEPEESEDGPEEEDD